MKICIASPALIVLIAHMITLQFFTLYNMVKITLDYKILLLYFEAVKIKRRNGAYA
jgi:hypothetical protein